MHPCIEEVIRNLQARFTPRWKPNREHGAALGPVRLTASSATAGRVTLTVQAGRDVAAYEVHFDGAPAAVVEAAVEAAIDEATE